jgi:hypothetical protein
MLVPVTLRLHACCLRVPLSDTPRRPTTKLAPMPLPTLSRPLKRVPHHCCAPFSSPAHFSPSPAMQAHPSHSLLGLVSPSGRRTAATRTVFTPPCYHFPTHSELNPRAPFSLSRVVPHFPLLCTLLPDLLVDVVDHRSTADGKNSAGQSTFSTSPTSGRLGEHRCLSCCPAQPPSLPRDLPTRHATPSPLAMPRRPHHCSAPKRPRAR